MFKYDESYLNFNLWLDYYYQYRLVASTGCRHILEVGKGTGVFEAILKQFNYNVTTADNNPDTAPDYLCDVRRLPFGNGVYDVVCAYEVLEHIPFSDFKTALCEMSRVSKRYLAISLPYASIYLSLAIMPPQAVVLKKFYGTLGIKLGEPIKLNLTFPLFFLGTRLMHKEHCWEMGRGEYSTKRIAKTIEEAGLKIVKKEGRVLLPYHVFYLLEKCN